MVGVQRDGLEDVAVVAELALRDRAVPRSHRPRAAIAADLQFGLADVARRVQAIEGVQRRGSGRPLEPSQKAFRGAGVAETQEGLHREGGVAQPREAVVPVPRAPIASGRPVVTAAATAPLGAKVSSARASPLRRTASRHGPSYDRASVHPRHQRSVCASRPSAASRVVKGSAPRAMGAAERTTTPLPPALLA